MAANWLKIREFATIAILKIRGNGSSKAWMHSFQYVEAFLPMGGNNASKGRKRGFHSLDAPTLTFHARFADFQNHGHDLAMDFGIAGNMSQQQLTRTHTLLMSLVHNDRELGGDMG